MHDFSVALGGLAETRCSVCVCVCVWWGSG